jgi:hypothetical protein
MNYLNEDFAIEIETHHILYHSPQKSHRPPIFDGRSKPDWHAQERKLAVADQRFS